MNPRRVQAATYLADNTRPALRALVDALTAAGVETEMVESDAASSPKARERAPDTDLVWMCGGLAAEMDRDAAFDHEVIAAPVFDGETEPVYRSVYVARPDGPGSLVDAAPAARFARNEIESWSGHHGVRRHLESLGLGWFTDVIDTGSHRASIDAVAHGRADIAAIDHTVWDGVASDVSDAVVVIATTEVWPSPPLLVHPRLADDARSTLDAVLATFSHGPVTRFTPTSWSAYEMMVR